MQEGIFGAPSGATEVSAQACGYNQGMPQPMQKGVFGAPSGATEISAQVCCYMQGMPKFTQEIIYGAPPGGTGEPAPLPDLEVTLQNCGETGTAGTSIGAMGVSVQHPTIVSKSQEFLLMTDTFDSTPQPTDRSTLKTTVFKKEVTTVTKAHKALVKQRSDTISSFKPSGVIGSELLPGGYSALDHMETHSQYTSPRHLTPSPDPPDPAPAPSLSGLVTGPGTVPPSVLPESHGDIEQLYQEE